MKWSEIPKFTKVGNYQVSTSLRYLLDWIDEHVEEMNLLLNPNFQRGHVWSKEQQIAYVEYLLKGGTSGRVFYFNHPGWMEDWENHEGYHDFVCVDGLQMLTALTRFLKNEIRAFGCLYREFEGKLPSNIGIEINVNNLQIEREVLNWYLEMNSGGTPHTQEELDRVRKLVADLG